MIRHLLERLAARIDHLDGRRWPRLACWSYGPRPYDVHADVRRWRWQRPTPCGRVAALAELTYCRECARPVLVMRGHPAPTECARHQPIIEPGTVTG